MKRIMSLLRATLATLLLWHALPTLAAELPPLSLADANAKQAVILDTRASYFYQGWPMEGEQQGGHVVGAENLSAEWKYSDEEWPAALATKGLKADLLVALYGAPREVAEVARLLRQQGIKQLFELQGWKTAPREHLARWQQLVYPRWLADLQEGKPVVAAPKGDWKLFEVAWGSPKAYLLSHIPGPATSTPTGWKRSRCGTRSLTRRSRRCCWRTASATTPPSSSTATPWRRPARPT